MEYIIAVIIIGFFAVVAFGCFACIGALVCAGDFLDY